MDVFVKINNPKSSLNRKTLICFHCISGCFTSSIVFVNFCELLWAIGFFGISPGVTIVLIVAQPVESLGCMFSEPAININNSCPFVEYGTPYLAVSPPILTTVCCSVFRKEFSLNDYPGLFSGTTVDCRCCHVIHEPPGPMYGVQVQCIDIFSGICSIFRPPWLRSQARSNSSNKKVGSRELR